MAGAVGSNLRYTIPKTDALPLGHAPKTFDVTKRLFMTRTLLGRAENTYLLSGVQP